MIYLMNTESKGTNNHIAALQNIVVATTKAFRDEVTDSILYKYRSS